MGSAHVCLYCIIYVKILFSIQCACTALTGNVPGRALQRQRAEFPRAKTCFSLLLERKASTQTQFAREPSNQRPLATWPFQSLQAGAILNTSIAQVTAVGKESAMQKQAGNYRPAFA